MKAGQTEHEVGTRIRVTKISGNEPEDHDDQKMVGITGTLDHPFSTIMFLRPEEYLAGIHVDEECKDHPAKLNLCKGDEYEVI